MRESWIDYAKCILIYLMIVAHSGRIPSSIDTLVCGFHMPAFFMISGYLTHFNAQGFRTMLFSSTKRLLIPAFFFTGVCYVPWCIQQLRSGLQFSLQEFLFKPLLGLFIYDRDIATPICGVIWFVIVLFICRIIMYCLKDVKIGYVLFGLGVLSLWISFIQVGDFSYLYYLERTAVSLPFLYVGHLLKITPPGSSITNNRLLIGIGLLFYIVFALLNGRCGIHSFTFGHGLLTFYMVAVLGSISFFYLLRQICHRPNKLIIYISKNTLTVLCLHRLFLPYTGFMPEGFSQSLLVLFLLLPFIYVLNRFVPTLIGNKK